jgi:NAD(P)-dependent dehydrogenase (short-subunit alcohol dehydrogenase family)
VYQSNKCVVITGGSSGIGLDLARRFVERGANVLINGSDTEKLERARLSLNSDHVTAVAGDVADPNTAAKLSAEVKRRGARLDVLVNNAGIFAVKPFLETRIEELDRFLNVNLKGTYQVTQALLPYMIASQGGSIINIGTVLVGHAKTDVPVSAAMASKGGLHALTVSWAAEFAKHNVRVNTIAPGIIRTPLIGPSVDTMAAWHPLGRVGEVSDISDAALYLADAGFVTGNVLNVDGGYACAR